MSDDYKEKVEEVRNKYLEFVKAHPKTIAVVVVVLAVFAFIAAVR